MYLWLFEPQKSQISLNLAGTRAVVASNSIQTSTKCEFYNQTMCANPNDPNCKDVEECEQPEDGKRSHCFVVWTEDENGVMNVSLKVGWIIFCHKNTNIAVKQFKLLFLRSL